MAIAPPAARAEVEPVDNLRRPRILLSPDFTVQEIYTDNVLLTDVGRKSDVITRGVVGLTAEVNDGPLTGAVNARYAYDLYARSSGLDGGSASAEGSGQYAIVKGRLLLEANGVVTQGALSTFDAPAVDRSGTPGRTQLAIYRIGPRISTPLGSFADLGAAFRFQQVFYTGSDLSAGLRQPSDSSAVQAVFSLDTANRSSRLQLLTTGEFQHATGHFESANAVQSLYVRLAPKLRVIARGGYERISEPGIASISSPILSGGLEFAPNQASLIRLEVGRRFGRTAWSGQANLKVSDRIFVTADYAESVTPDQLFVANSFAEFVSETASLPPPVAPTTTTFTLQENVYNQTSYNRAAEARARLQGATQTLELSMRWSDRHFLTTDGHDRSLTADAAYTRRMRRDLELHVDAGYTRTFASPLYGPSRTWGGGVGLIYKLNSTSDFTAAYRFKDGRQLVGGGEHIRENVVLMSLEKRF